MRHGADSQRWEFSLAPTISALSFHANYHTAPIGYDLSLRCRFADRWTVEIGHTESGSGRDRPRRDDGTYLRTQPFDQSRPDPEGDLQVKAGTTYALLGLEQRWRERLSIGVACGVGRTNASFMSISPAYPLPFARYTEQVDRTAFLGQARAGWTFGGGWKASLAVRYTELQGVQITFPLFEPDFGNTKVRMWSLPPQIALEF